MCECSDPYLIVHTGKETMHFYERGIKRLWYLTQHEEKPLRGARVEDSIVGKAAASLMVYAGVREVNAGVLSEGGKLVFEMNNIPYTYRELVPYIVNRKGGGMCPMEEAVQFCPVCLSPVAIKRKLIELGELE